MVMQNRSDGSGAPHWWDDLPPSVRQRFTRPLGQDEQTEPTPRTPEPPPPLTRGELVGDLSRLALLFALVAVGNILFLLLALCFLNS